jgi:aminoglycoside phosphotransferase (APT) family kinase protein
VDAVVQLVLGLFPGGHVEEVRPLGADDATRDATHKQIGYGVPVRIQVRDQAGKLHRIVFHAARPDAHGHDHRADRVQEMLLVYDEARRIPRHVAALDVGVIGADGTLRSLADTGEPYLVTEWAEGIEYAEDLRRAATEGASHDDHARVDLLADYLAALHEARCDRSSLYARELRDVVGGGEGIFGIVDGYPADAPAAPRPRLQRLEERCVAWRWRLRDRTARVRRIHGDFHPFNIVFAPDGQLRLLDASRGCAGDPANDVTALAINYVFFALDHPGAWRGLGALWHRLWDRYLERTGDREVLDVAAPYLAWRALVVASPRWYPGLSADGRDRLLTWIEDVLDAPRLVLASADGVAP